MFLFVFYIISISFCGFWEVFTNYDLTTGFNDTCSEQKMAYKSEFTGTSNKLNFQIKNTQGFHQIFYTFNLYYTHPQSLQFSENLIQFYEQFLEEQSQDYFSFCDSFYSVKYARLNTNNLLDQNFIQFKITADTPHQFILTNLKIYFKRCQTNCKICNINGVCEQCMNNFQLNQDYKCQCYYQKPIVFINECVEQCPLGYFPYYYKCIIHTFKNLLLIDENAEKHILISDFNTTNRLTKIFIDGKIQAGSFIQNEAISYYLEEQINTSTDLCLELELYIFNSKNLFFLSIYLDEIMFKQLFLNELTKNEKGLENILQECIIPNYSQCFKVKFELNIEKLEQLKYIKIQWNLPLQNPNIFWTLNFIKLYEVRYEFSDSINQNQNNQCPITTKLVGSECVSITKQYPFSKITNKNFTSFLEDENNHIFFQQQQFYDFNFYQQYQDRYIFGGHRKWQSEQYIFDFNISQPHYKIKIYFKILLIDPLQSSDQFLIKILDKSFTFSKDSPQSQCFSIKNTINCNESENIGLNSNDYMIQFEEEFEHNISIISIFMQCITNSNTFYCGYYDFIILVANCPLNCEKCLDSNSCEQTSGTKIKEILEVKYVCDEGYYNFDGSCYQCANYCKICENNLKCITCKDDYHKIGNQCICSYNHINAYFTDCQQQCHKSCSVCQKQSLYSNANIKFCSKCNQLENKVLNVNKCVCMDGYYMNEQTDPFQCSNCDQTCKTCKNAFVCESCNLEQNRVLDDFKCVCQPGYYEQNSQNSICLKCQSQCKTCLFYPNNCISCYLSQYRTLNSNNICQCQQGYYEDENKNCQKCNFKCESCKNIQNCLSCNQDLYRILIKQQCQCQEGYYEDQNNFECQKCYYTCSKCNYNNLYNQCTLCPITRIKKLQNLLNTFQCQCKKGYYENYELNCLSCQNYINPPQNHYCYSKCGDLIIQWNEDCDDGNLIERDNCYQCKFQNSSCNNKNCLKCQQNECIQCKDGYYQNDLNQCLQCSNNCLTCKFNENNCIQCKYLIQNTNKCLLCNEDQGYKIIDEQCYPICGDGIKTLNEQCDDGNSINNDGCNQYCQIEQNYICNFDCQKINYIQIQLKQIDKSSIYQSQRKIELTFNQKVKFQSESQIKELIIIESVQNDLKIKNLEIFDFTDYSNELLNVFIQIQFDIEDSYIEPKIKVQILNSNLLQNENQYSLQQSISFITLTNYNKPNQKMIELTKSSIILNNYILYFLLGLAIISFIFGGLEIFWNLLDTLQLISYFKYLNINYPYNLQQYFLIFNFAQFDFIKNYFDLQSLISGKIDATQAPQKFDDDGYSTLFLINIISIAIIFLSQFIIYYAFKLIIYLEKKLLNYLKSTFNIEKSIIFYYFFMFSIKLKKKIFLFISQFNNIILRTYFATVFEINIIIFLQLKYFQQKNSFQLFNFILSFFILFIQFILINSGINLMSQSKPFFQQFQIKSKYGTFFEGINLNRGKINYYFNIIGLIKKILFAASLVWFYEYVSFQIGISFLLSLSFVSFLILKRPLLNPNELQKQIILSIVQLIIFTFGFFQEKNRTLFINTIEDSLGISIIILLSLLLLVQLIIDFKQQIQHLVKKYHLLKKWKKLNEAKLFPIREQDNTINQAKVDKIQKKQKRNYVEL